MALPIGYDDFGTIIEKKLNFVDKSLFIKEVLDNEEVQITVITRPRRFGKTLNLSMLHYFLASDIGGLPTQGLFDTFKIASAGSPYMRQQGKYPVVSVTFKDVQDNTFEMAYDSLCALITKLYAEHRYLMDSPKLYEEEKEAYRFILRGEIKKQVVLTHSLERLSYYLYQHHGVKPWILIDEYDSPIQSAYLNGYYEPMIQLMRALFGKALKNNRYLNRAVVTGILRISKESLFSGMNNLVVHSLLSKKYSTHFGFTELEVADLLQQAHLEEHAPEIKNWYNGYLIGETTLYNPWSIVNCIANEGKLGAYWVNSSGNYLVRDLIINSSMYLKDELEPLLLGSSIERTVDENMVFGDLRQNESALWSLLLMTGYLKVISQEWVEDEFRYQLQIPNKEVTWLYKEIFQQWLTDGKDSHWYNQFIHYLLNGEMQLFEEKFKELMEHTVSNHDFGKTPEAFYHGFFLGLTATLGLNPHYEIKSNKESGYGRYDYFIFSRDLQKPSILLEFKRIPDSQSKKIEMALDETAREALKQIDDQRYFAEAKQRGASHILKIGLAFSGKKFKFIYHHDQSV